MLDELLEALLCRTPAPLRRLVRYGFVGLALSIFYSLAVILLVVSPLRLNPTLASVMAFVLTMPVGWAAHRSVSFADRAYDAFQPLRFAASNAAAFVAAVGGMYLITVVAGHSYLLGIAWNWLIIPGANFVAYLFWVFRDARVSEDAA